MFEKGELQPASIYVEKGIEFSIKENDIRFLPDLFIINTKILYKEHKYEEARKYYDNTEYLYRITHKDNKIAELRTSSKKELPELFQ